MTIESINHQNPVKGIQQILQKNEADTKSTGQTTSKRRGDTIELSSEAKNLQPIQAKISASVYNKPEVLYSVAKHLSSIMPPLSKKDS